MQSRRPFNYKDIAQSVRFLQLNAAKDVTAPKATELDLATMAEMGGATGPATGTGQDISSSDRQREQAQLIYNNAA